MIARSQIAEVLVDSLVSDHALSKSFELTAVAGPAPTNVHALFKALEPDAAGQLDAVRDVLNMPLDQEPQRVRDDLAAFEARRAPDRNTQ